MQEIKIITMPIAKPTQNTCDDTDNRHELKAVKISGMMTQNKTRNMLHEIHKV